MKTYDTHTHLLPGVSYAHLECLPQRTYDALMREVESLLLEVSTLNDQVQEKETAVIAETGVSPAVAKRLREIDNSNIGDREKIALKMQLAASAVPFDVVMEGVTDGIRRGAPGIMKLFQTDDDGEDNSAGGTVVIQFVYTPEGL